MSDFRQRVLNRLQNCTSKNFAYSLAIIANPHQKTYSEFSRTLGLKYRSIYDNFSSLAEDANLNEDSFIGLVLQHRTESNSGKLIFDFTRLKKSKDTMTPMTTWDRDARINAVNNGFSSGFCMWSNDKISIPLSFCFWQNRKDSGDGFESKKLLAKESIRSAIKRVGKSEVIVDGEFSTLEMMDFFAEEGIDFTARIACNRKVLTDDGSFLQLRLHKGLQLHKNQKSKAIRGYISGRSYNFTAVRQKTRGGKKKIVFIVSTIERSSQTHMKTYSSRWVIEKFFRSAKQSLGLEDCRSQKFDGIVKHIWAVMRSFTTLELLRFAKRKKSVEAVLAILRDKKRVTLSRQYADLIETLIEF